MFKATKKIFLKRKNDKSLSTTTSSSSSTYITTPVNCSPAHSRRTSTSSINNSTITSTTTNSNDYNIHTLGSSTTPSTGEMVVTSGQLVLSTIENSFSNYLPIIGIISSLCERIIKSYETVKDNKKICGVLIDRVELTHLAVKQLVRAKEENEENFREESYFKAFNRLQKVLENIENFIKNMSNYGAFKHFVNAEHCKKCFEDYCDDLDKVCADLQFNITIRIYHNLEKMWEIFYESFKNVGTLETQGKLVLIGKLNKSMKTNDFDFNQELLKIPKIDTNEIEDVKPQDRKSTDIRGKDKNVVKKVLKRTVDVASWETVPYERHTFGEVMDVLTGLWKKHGSCNYLAKFLPKNEISDDKLHSHSIEKPTDFEKNINLARQYLQSAALQGHNEEIKRRAIELINKNLDEYVRCYCGNKANRRYSVKNQREYFSCEFYFNEPKKACKFFQWVDIEQLRLEAFGIINKIERMTFTSSELCEILESHLVREERKLRASKQSIELLRNLLKKSGDYDNNNKVEVLTTKTTAQEVIQKLEEKNQDLEERNQELEKKNQEIEETNQILKLDIINLQEEKIKASEEVKKYESELDDLRSTLNSLITENEEIEAEFEDLNNQCNEIKEFQEELAKEKIRNQQLVNDNYLLRRENEANIKLVHSLQQYIKNNK
ncbi:14216_t:CDS:2 [Entrophospora sp. SA101]|nr:14216_t:CDS:2 [Entrophospora sp. SA101]